MKFNLIPVPTDYAIIVGVTDAVMRDVAARMRQSDLDELAASGSLDPLDTLRKSVAVSEPAHVITYKDVPLAVGGLVMLNESTGCPWQLCTEDAPHHAKGIVRLGKQGLAHWLTRRPHLTNFVDSRNTQSIQWLKWMGFTLGDPVDMFPSGVPFIQFSISRSSANV